MDKKKQDDTENKEYDITLECKHDESKKDFKRKLKNRNVSVFTMSGIGMFLLFLVFSTCYSIVINYGLSATISIWYNYEFIRGIFTYMLNNTLLLSIIFGLVSIIYLQKYQIDNLIETLRKVVKGD